jgi:hypothetical protein
MNETISAPLFAGGLFLGMLVLLEVGRRLGRRRLISEGAAGGFGAVESAIFALFGLLVAFTFSGAVSRFDSRRALIADEANAIGTAYLRLDLLGATDRSPMQQMFREYLDSRLDVYRKLPDVDAAFAALARSADIQQKIWTRSLNAIRTPDAHPNSPILLIPALNEMFDITTTRTMAARTHPPAVIYGLLFLLGLGCALLAGHAMAGVPRWSWLHAAGFAAFVSVVTFVIVDIEYPRRGLIRLSAFDQVLVELRESMK